MISTSGGRIKRPEFFSVCITVSPIMESLKIILLLLALLQLAASSCPSGWTQFRSHCYMTNTKRTNYEAHRQLCQSLGADIASISDQEENDFVANTMNHSGWICLVKRGDRWLWDDGNPSYWKNWDPNRKC